uniref:DUF2252 domain-containing protein n=1 Tax=Attheya septentrionalis TaxID=420275 RepID=A0A7S2XPS5_9STRA|mmetsp:Transcript_27753/g.50422  ORF Transcript_27753/g.50422 Transcript_27753/m.50422 type:complete len:601 (+) Transcript_27753:147-1949(+)
MDRRKEAQLGEQQAKKDNHSWTSFLSTIGEKTAFLSKPSMATSSGTSTAGGRTRHTNGRRSNMHTTCSLSWPAIIVWMMAGMALSMGLLSWMGTMSTTQVHLYHSSSEHQIRHGSSHRRGRERKVSEPVELDWEPPQAYDRCDHVIELCAPEAYEEEQNQEELHEKYSVQAKDFNVFFRATARLFWLDFAAHQWANVSFGFTQIGMTDVTLSDGSALQSKSAWTWITGDQHLSNFGAWKNRHEEVVFSVNDFDEAAIYDFHIDVLRIAVSICNHALTNGFSYEEAHSLLHSFTKRYVKTIESYIGNDAALLYEITPDTATGVMKKWLQHVDDKESTSKQIDKFTEFDSKGNRKFSKDDRTRLVTVSPETEQKIRRAFTSEQYGATMMKMGWHVHEWDDDYFTILDVAARIGSGVGSYGVDRYYILLKGEDGLLAEDEEDGTAVILDIKYEPQPAVSGVLDKDDVAWFANIFPNEAARAVEAQRRLTSYVDPFTGWVKLDGEVFVVRQRSPWKDSFDLDDLTDLDDFKEFIQQVAIATATSHTRGTVAKSPGQFKHVIAAVLGNKSDRNLWGEAVARVALSYHQQVLRDFSCFHAHVQKLH